MCLMIVSAPVACLSGGSECADGSYWSALVHEENSIVASVLYLPYIVFKLPVRLVDGIVNPKPTTQATAPPAAHKVK